MHFFHVFFLTSLALGGCGVMQPAAMASPTYASSSASRADGEPLEFKGVVVGEDADHVVLADAEHPEATVKLAKDRILSIQSDRVILRPSQEAAAATPAPALSIGAGAMAAQGPMTSCRGLVRFRCNDDGTSDPIGVCLGIYDCRAEPR